MEGFDLLGAVAGKADGPAVGECAVLAVNRLCQAERAGLGTIEHPPSRIGLAFRNADGAKRGIVELLGLRDVVRADEDV